MQIAGLQKTSLVDYPAKIASVIFTLGCNFRCPYCHNPNLIAAVSSDNLFDETVVFDFLKQRQGKIDAIVVSGGEPTLQKDLITFFMKVKELGFLTKLDTNGSNPDILLNLVNSNLVDYIAMDIKSPLEKYSNVVGRNVDILKIQESIDILMQCGVDYEFRTTVVKSQLTTKDFEKIGHLLSGAKRYYLQKFVNKTTLDFDFKYEQTYNDEEFKIIKDVSLKYMSQVYVR